MLWRALIATAPTIVLAFGFVATAATAEPSDHKAGHPWAGTATHVVVHPRRRHRRRRQHPGLRRAHL
jgi:hypothetical protein